MDKLAPCPFCGGEAYVVKHHYGMWDNKPKDFFVICLNCNAASSHYSNTEEKAIEAWNRRTQSHKNEKEGGISCLI